GPLASVRRSRPRRRRLEAPRAVGLAPRDPVRADAAGPPRVLARALPPDRLTVVAPAVPALGLTRLGRWLFLAGVFLRVPGDWPQSPIRPTRWVARLPSLGWPWLYLPLLAAAFVMLLAGRALSPRRKTTTDFLRPAIAALTASFLISVLFS